MAFGSDSNFSPEEFAARRRRAAAVLIATGVAGIALAIGQAFFGVTISFTGALGGMNRMLVNNFGPIGPALLSAALGVFALAMGIRIK
jgi:hypothetical protein